METDPKYFRIGLFTIGLISLAVMAFILFSKLDVFNKQNLYTIYFSGSVNGLRENEDVKFHGISIGKVKKITISKSHVDKVKVIVDIMQPRLIRTNVVARIEAQGLTGFTFVQLYGGDDSQPVLTSDTSGKNPVIPSSPSNIESLITEAPKIFDNVNGLLKQMKQFFDDKTMNDLKETVANFKKVSATLEPESKKISMIIEDLHNSLQSVSHITKSVDAFINNNQQSVNDFTGQTLPRINTLIEQLQATTQTIHRIAGQVETNPINYLQHTTEPGYQLP